MTTPTGRRKKRFPNPFYVALLIVSTGFVVTALAYLVAPMMDTDVARRQTMAKSSPAAWVERQAPTLLGIECALMIATGALAMATDRWFSEPTS